LHQKEYTLFSQLKKEVAATMMKSCPGIDPDISNWKGKDITDFQEDLLVRVNGQISEKWFYTHMKTGTSSLPRIDVLNLLSRYSGYMSWQDFCHRNLSILPSAGKPVSLLIKITVVLISVITLFFILIEMIKTPVYRFAVVDSDTGEPLAGNEIRVELLMENESPVVILPDSSGHISVRTRERKIKMIVKAQYYFTDTITKTLRKYNNYNRIILNPDYYAIMISYFSQSDVDSWEERREQLAGIFSDDAIIFQFPGSNNGNGLSLYNKWEFIDKITMPTTGLKNIEIIDCRYLNGKVAVMRFTTKEQME